MKSKYNSSQDRLKTQLVAALTDHLGENSKKMMVPEAGQQIWSWFLDLNRTRTYGSTGPNPISFTEIDAYGRLKRWEFQPHHLKIIQSLDKAFIDHFRSQARSESRTSPPPATQEINPSVFDAVFS